MSRQVLLEVRSPLAFTQLALPFGRADWSLSCSSGSSGSWYTWRMLLDLLLRLVFVSAIAADRDAEALPGAARLLPRHGGRMPAS